ncbi:class I SAM-dependent methyltransferase [Streptococcus gordonii]|uniref:class I SAM-dependent methyltransferase n=1 Tax=Streptococcus gordonii TaxID=1302 RepID=UPI001CBC7B0C|nr:class I SAM-dependent methyltransferase [Streptococcus gordonii]MBZ2133695.1 class I SAM-dependent methyltransferase [Streptococcus gordonii]MBZ2142819.1 class I SAM-dependent methyltransferase [Streptococcus gordonii]MBZ2144778.1 class I SAM-dependent methyltransferase [Streptococcus gordonii]MBZ2147027.1 class I SAM-dependent methyltransferase [Streptococcus gordonii]
MIYLAMIGLMIILAFPYLIYQSKKPSGFVGLWMMKLWNRVYMPMVVWSIGQLDHKKQFKAILDVGVGNGVSSKYLKKHFPDSQVLGIDISTTAIKSAEELSEPGLSFEVKNVENTNLPVEKFDLITAFQTHFHWSNLTQAFLELKRILKPDGIILLACEWSKLAYYQPDFKKHEKLESFLTALDLHLIDSQRKEQWILYQIVKN